MRRVTPNTSYVKALFTGRSGSTKTRTAYSATLDPRFQPVLAIDAWGQPRSIDDYRPRPDILSIDHIDEIYDILRWLQAGQPKNHSMVKNFDLNPPYKTVVPDGFSEIQRQLGLNLAGGGDQRAYYGRVLTDTLKIVEGFYRLPMHVIGTVLEQERQEGEDGPIMFRHLLVGQARDQLSSYAEVVGRLVHVEKLAPKLKTALAQYLTDESVSVCYFKPSLRHEAKDQTGKLGHMMVDPTMAKIADVLGIE